MTTEPLPVRVKPMSRILDGEDPVAFMLRLTEIGHGRFYVHVPEGFRCHFKEPGHLFAHRILHKQDAAPSFIRHHGEPSFLQLDEWQVQKLIEHQPIALHIFSAGALFRRMRTDGRPSIDFDHQSIRQGVLEPIGHSVASATPTVAPPGLGSSIVLKAAKPSSNMYSYFLSGVDFNDIYVEEAAINAALSTENQDAPPGDVPSDPYGLERSSPLVFQILESAYRNRNKAKIDTPSLAADFRKLNDSYTKNPRPFNDGRHEFAATLANPRYNYSADGLSEISLPVETVEVPADTFLDQPFINNRLKKILYAACRWSGAMGPGLQNDREELVDLLVGLGFFDREDSDQVQASVYFITGKKYTRNKYKSEFRHIRGDRM